MKNSATRAPHLTSGNRGKWWKTRDRLACESVGNRAQEGRRSIIGERRLPVLTQLPVIFPSSIATDSLLSIALAIHYPGASMRQCDQPIKKVAQRYAFARSAHANKSTLGIASKSLQDRSSFPGCGRRNTFGCM